MNVLKSKQLREERAKLIADTRAILNKDGFAAEDRAKVEAMDADIAKMEGEIELNERQEKRELELATSGKELTGAGDDKEARAREAVAKNEKYSAAFEAYCRHGIESMDAEQRSILKSGMVDKEGRANMGVASGAVGGYSVPIGFQPELEKAEKAFGGVREQSRILKTGSGNPLHWPTADDTGNSGEDSTENTAVSEQTVTLGEKILNAYKMDSGLIYVSTELLEDTGIPLVAELGSMIGERLARRKNNKYTLGAGTTTFQGCVVAASAAAGLVSGTGTFASATAITADELFDVQHSVDPAYRNNPKVAWMFNDSTFKAVRKLKDSQNRYLFEASINVGAPDMLLGKPIVINQDMASIATGNKTVLFGDFNKFIIRDVRDVVIRRLNERFAELDQVAFIAFYRGDSQLVSASTKALVYAKQA